VSGDGRGKAGNGGGDSVRLHCGGGWIV
jgi:hypothetical protein